MKTRSLVVLFFALICGTTFSQKNIEPITRQLIEEHRIGEDTLLRLQYFSPIDRDIVLELIPSDNAVEVKKSGDLKIKKEIITILHKTMGIMLPPDSIEYIKDPKTGQPDKKAGIRKIRVCFDEINLQNFLTFKRDPDGKFVLMCEKGGIVNYGGKKYHLLDYSASDNSNILYIKNIFLTKKRFVGGRKVTNRR